MVADPSFGGIDMTMLVTGLFPLLAGFNSQIIPAVALLVTALIL